MGGGALSWCVLRTNPEVVGLGGLEPPTSRLSVEYSNQLSYSPIGCPARGAGRGCRSGKKEGKPDMWLVGRE